MNRFFPILVLLLIFLSCRNKDLIDDSQIFGGCNKALTPDWTEETHSNLAEPNYTVVFPQNKIVEITLVVPAENWETMQQNLDYLLNERGARKNEEPVWVYCSVLFNQTEWYKVGLRFKGNSSLYSIIGNKYSFKLDFDEFEDEFPEITNQRFYGFKQLSLKNNFKDASLMHEKAASDLFRRFGIPSARTAFCKLYIDSGNGEQYYGLYTLTEEVDDTMLKNQFGSDSGNLYKPENDAAKFSRNTYNETDYQKKNNEELNDYSDIKALYDIINSSLRNTDPKQWKSNLECVFDVNHFLKWLAANTTMQNWDTYGNMGHNYYLYNNPENNKLTWIPWDNNEALTIGNENKVGISGRMPLSLGLNEVNDEWPLISFLLAINEYRIAYNNYLDKFINKVFIPDQMRVIYSEHYTLIKEAVYEEEDGYTFLRSKNDFEKEVQDLKNHTSIRFRNVKEYLEGQEL